MAAPSDAEVSALAESTLTNYYLLFNAVNENEPNEAEKAKQTAKQVELLSEYYRPDSTLTFEGPPIRGVEAIVSRLLTALNRSTFNYSSLDSQLAYGGQSIITTVTGRVKLGGEEHDMGFTQIFVLASDPTTGQRYIHNNFFKVIFG